MMAHNKSIETLLWSIAFPGFGQFLNRKYVKGIVLIVLEFVINLGANLNQIILLSFLGEIEEAIRQVNFQWLMFYPCVYMFGMWDAYKDAGGGTSSYAFLPFVSAAYFATVGVMYSSRFRIMGVFVGPVWLPMLLCFMGIGIGISVRHLLLKWK